jgi:hypothetical protein
MTGETLFALLRRLDRRVLPANACCADCEFSVRLCLFTTQSVVLCAACELRRRGLAPFEEHHIGGGASPLTLHVDANLHRVLTVLQDIWRGTYEPGSTCAVLLDMVFLRVLEPFFLGGDK